MANLPQHPTELDNFRCSIPFTEENLPDILRFHKYLKENAKSAPEAPERPKDP